MILVSKRIDTALWTALDIGSPDITAINLKTDAGNMTIYNFYCDQQHSEAITSADNFAQERAQNSRNLTHSTHNIWLGDFNRHHPNWDDLRNVHLFTRNNLDMAQMLTDTTTWQNLVMALPRSHTHAQSHVNTKLYKARQCLHVPILTPTPHALRHETRQPTSEN